VRLFRRRASVEAVEPPTPPTPPTAPTPDEPPTLRSADDLMRFEGWLAARRGRRDAIGLVARQWNDQGVRWQEAENRRALQETIMRFLANDALE
jgi:hypothetical protein